MLQNINIKSSAHGISIQIKKAAYFEELLQEIAEKFEAGRSFFGSARVTLDVKGAELSEEQLDQVLQTVLDHSDLQIFATIEEADASELSENASDYEEESSEEDFSKAYIHYGNVTAQDVIDSPQTVVIVGDINAGGKVISDRDVIVLGSCFGEIHAGLEDDHHIIVLLSAENDRIRIGSHRYHKKKEGFFSKDNPSVAKLLYVRDGEIKVETVSKQILGKLF